MGDNKRKSEITKMMTEMEFSTVFLEEKVDLAKHNKVPISQLAALGTAFEPLIAALQNITGSTAGQSGIYKVSVPPGLRMAEFNNKSGYLGSVLTETGAVGGGQAVLNPFVCNPTMLFAAATFMNIDKKLDKIQETQQEIMNLLVQKEKSELRGDLNFLNDVINNYKFNWNNDMYKNNNHIKVLDIKQSSERKVDFYREQITSRINKKSFFKMEQEVKKQLRKLQTWIKDYQLALYLFSFSSFLEVILLENYESEYLESITSKIEKYSLNYRELYTKCYNYIEANSDSSIQSNLLKGLAKVNTLAGKGIEKIPVISKSQIDEKLIETGNKLEKYNSGRKENTMQQFIEKESSIVRPFIESINVVNYLYNQPMEILIDKENVYLAEVAV